MADVKTLADLPFHVSGRFPKEVLLQRCHADGTNDLSSRDLFEKVRDLSLGLSGLGILRQGVAKRLRGSVIKLQKEKDRKMINLREVLMQHLGRPSVDAAALQSIWAEQVFAKLAAEEMFAEEMRRRWLEISVCSP